MVFGVETDLWSTTEKMAGKLYFGLLGAAERFVVKWHEGKAKQSRKRLA